MKYSIEFFSVCGNSNSSIQTQSLLYEVKKLSEKCSKVNKNK